MNTGATEHVVQPLDPASLAVVARVVHKLRHDLSNSLVAAMGELDLLASDATDPALTARLRETHGLLLRPFASLRRLGQSLPLPGGVPARGEDTLRQLETRALESNITLRWDAETRAQLLATPWLLPAAAALVCNALDATPAGGHVDIALHVARGELRVSDDGSGCPQLALAAAGLWQRAGGLHVGLGLPVAAAVLAARGGHLSLAALQPAGIIARATWPAAAEPPNHPLA